MDQYDQGDQPVQAATDKNDKGQPDQRAANEIV
jgi:hypothetical protein